MTDKYAYIDRDWLVIEITLIILILLFMIMAAIIMWPFLILKMIFVAFGIVAIVALGAVIWAMVDDII